MTVRSPQLESLWFDESKHKKSKRKLKKLFSNNKTSQLLQLFDIELESSRKKAYRSPSLISTPFAFDHVCHISDKQTFGIENSFEGTDLSLLPFFLEQQHIQNDGKSEEEQNEEVVEEEAPSIKTLDPILSGQLPFQAYSSFRTSPTPVSHVEKVDAVLKHARTRSTSSISNLISRSNSTFTKSTSMSTLNSLTSSIQNSNMYPNSPAKKGSVSGTRDTLQMFHSRLPSIPQEDSDESKETSNQFNRSSSNTQYTDYSYTRSDSLRLPHQQQSQHCESLKMSTSSITSNKTEALEDDSDVADVLSKDSESIKIERFSFPVSLARDHAKEDDDASIAPSVSEINQTTASESTPLSFNHHSFGPPSISDRNEDDSDIVTFQSEQQGDSAPQTPIQDNSKTTTPQSMALIVFNNSPSSLLSSSTHIKKVASVGSPLHSRHSSFTFELLSTPDIIRQNNTSTLSSNTSPSISLKNGAALLADKEFIKEANMEFGKSLLLPSSTIIYNGLNNENRSESKVDDYSYDSDFQLEQGGYDSDSDGEYDYEEEDREDDDFMNTLISLNAANASRYSRLNMTGELDKLAAGYKLGETSTQLDLGGVTEEDEEEEEVTL